MLFRDHKTPCILLTLIFVGFVKAAQHSEIWEGIAVLVGMAWFMYLLSLWLVFYPQCFNTIMLLDHPELFEEYKIIEQYRR